MMCYLKIGVCMENNKFKDFLEHVLYLMKIREEKHYINTGYCKGIQETLDKIIDIAERYIRESEENNE